MADCWSARGCDDEMRDSCPHAVDAAELCPVRCMYGSCSSPRHATPSDPLMLLDPEVDRSAAVREQCLYCEHFLTHAPRNATETSKE